MDYGPCLRKKTFEKIDSHMSMSQELFSYLAKIKVMQPHKMAY